MIFLNTLAVYVSAVSAFQVDEGIARFLLDKLGVMAGHIGVSQNDIRVRFPSN
jgi:hypothetical protein